MPGNPGGVAERKPPSNLRPFIVDCSELILSLAKTHPKARFTAEVKAAKHLAPS